jgi:hypothetical protein
MVNEPSVNEPSVLAEVTAEFERYENALVANDVAALDEFFWNSPLAIRYGGGENLYGFAEIAAFRAARSPAGLERSLEGTVITTFGQDYATASTMFRRNGTKGKIGRQMQTWWRSPQGWKIVAAHVSVIDDA